MSETTRWEPPSLEGVRTENLSYVVVDQITENEEDILLATLIIDAWPTVDEEGLFYFAETNEETDTAVVVELNSLRELLAEHGISRSLRESCVLAATPANAGSANSARDARTIFEGPIYDITADVHEMAERIYQHIIKTQGRKKK